MHKSLIKIAAFLLLGATATAAWAQSSIQGRVTRVENASLLHVQGVRLSLEGIVTPQDDSPLGREARGALRGLTWEARLICVLGEGSAAEVRPARCYFWDQTKPEAIRAELGEADKQPDHEAWLLYGDLAARLVQLGLARDCPALTGGRYASLETKSALQRIALPEACSP
jgi:hypothetical protein